MVFVLLFRMTLNIKWWCTLTCKTPQATTFEFTGGRTSSKWGHSNSISSNTRLLKTCSESILRCLSIGHLQPKWLLYFCSLILLSLNEVFENFTTWNEWDLLNLFQKLLDFILKNLVDFAGWWLYIKFNAVALKIERWILFFEITKELADLSKISLDYPFMLRVQNNYYFILHFSKIVFKTWRSRLFDWALLYS